MTVDAVLDSGFDFQIADNGDILTEDFFDTAILMSLFAERRAIASEMPDSFRRRGWIGNESTPGFEIGSKLWLYEQARVTRSLLSEIEAEAFNALKWLLDDNIVVNVFTAADFNDGKIILVVTIERPNSKVEKRYYEFWDNTGTKGTDFGFIPPASVFPNRYAARFVFASSQFLSLSSFSAYSDTTVGMAVNVKRRSANPSGTRAIVTHWGLGPATGRFALYWLNDKLVLRIRDSALNQHSITTTATFTDLSAIYKIQPEIDLTNSNAADRLVLRVDNVRKPVTDTGVPSSITLFNSSADFDIGRFAVWHSDEIIDEFTLVSDNIPPYSAYWDSHNNVKDRSGIAGIKAWPRFELPTNPWFDSASGRIWVPSVSPPTIVRN